MLRGNKTNHRAMQEQKTRAKGKRNSEKESEEIKKHGKAKL